MALPILTTLEDLNKWIDFLKNKISGVTIKEASSIVGKQYADGRKLSALQEWGILSHTGDTINLTPMGRDYVRADPDKRREILQGTLKKIKAYSSVFEWAHYQGISTLTTVDVAARWLEHNKEDVGTDNATSLNNGAVCMFHLAQGAGLGTLTIGRRGQPTRLEANLEALQTFISYTDFSPVVVEQPPEPITGVDGQESEHIDLGVPTGPIRESQRVQRLFIAHGKNKRITEQIKTILDFGGFEPVMAEEEETPAIPVPEKVMQAMRSCQAGIVNISTDHQITTKEGEPEYKINKNLLIEIGAAFVLYEKKVVLLVDDRVELPSNLQGLYLCRYKGDSLDFDATMKLQQTLTQFRG